jgi:hypothetical protein
VAEVNPTPKRADDALLAELGEVLRADGPTADVIAAAKELFTWRTVDAELAALTFDSLLDDDPAAVRATAAAPRLLTFEAAGVTVELEVELDVGAASGASRRLVGQVVPPRSGRVELVVDGRSRQTPVDDVGRFVVALPDEPGPIRLRLTTGGRDISVVAVV